MIFLPALRRSLGLVASAVMALAALSGCGSSPVKPKPGPLETIAVPASVRMLWSQRLEAVRFPLHVTHTAGVFTAAGDDGTVTALDVATGREIWRSQAGSKLSAGVGSDGRWAAVVTTDSHLVALEAGRVLWSKPLGVKVATRPLVAGERVFVQATDRSVHAFDAASGAKLWTVRRPGDPLTLNQAGVLTSFGNTLVVGQGARLVGLDPLNGSVVWETSLANPRGTNEIERLADLVGPAARVGDVICARAFQAAVACANAARGSLLWTRNVGGTQGVAANTQLVVAADSSDRITAWRATTGEVAWASEALLYRSLSTPLVIGALVAFGDAEGTVHLLSLETGKSMARLTTDGSAVQALSLATDGTFLVVTRNGGLFALRS